jgi:homocysteine S-methyltransferase
MPVQTTLKNHRLVLMEAAVIETLRRGYAGESNPSHDSHSSRRRSGPVALHPLLEHALLMYDDNARDTLSGLYHGYISVAHKAEIPIALCTPTWRANQERISTAQVTRNVNRDAVEYMNKLRRTWGSWASHILLGGLIGCKNDCYTPRARSGAGRCTRVSSMASGSVGRSRVDFLMAATLPAVPEALGIAHAMAETGVPYLISFVIGRNGRILDGSTLEDAFNVIEAQCRRPPLGFMVGCAYPSFLNASQQPESVMKRLVGYQANASSLDHTELDGAERLLADDVSDWGDRMIELNQRYGIKVLGGCCGTGREHLEYIVANSP